MKQLRVSFSGASDITNPGDDSRSFFFPFSVVPTDLVGEPEETQSTTQHRLVVTVSNNRLPAWRLQSDTDLTKVLFEIGSREALAKIKTGALEVEMNVSVNTFTHSRICPFDPARIRDPQSVVIEVEVERAIGFKGRP